MQKAQMEQARREEVAQQNTKQQGKLDRRRQQPYEGVWCACVRSRVARMLNWLPAVRSVLASRLPSRLWSMNKRL